MYLHTSNKRTIQHLSETQNFVARRRLPLVPGEPSRRQRSRRRAYPAPTPRTPPRGQVPSPAHAAVPRPGRPAPLAAVARSPLSSTLLGFSSTPVPADGGGRRRPATSTCGRPAVQPSASCYGAAAAVAVAISTGFHPRQGGAGRRHHHRCYSHFAPTAPQEAPPGPPSGNPSQPLLTPQTILSRISEADSFDVKRCGKLDLTPTTVPISIKTEPEADDGAGKDAGGETLGAPPHKKRHRDHLPVTPIQQPLFTPQATLPGISRADSSVDKWSEQPSATPTATVKRELDTDAGKDAGGKLVRRRRPFPQRPTTGQAPTTWANRGRLGRLLHNLVRSHQWRDAAGVFSVLLPGIQRPDSFEEARSILVDAMDIHRRLAQDSGGRRTYCHRTQKVIPSSSFQASCASHMLGPGFPYVKAAKSYLTKQEAMDESIFLSRNMENSVKLLQSLEKLT
ncbi:hypothetical protein ZWY2020_052442 [Hordeum vulgare]|nr:hypothetical protein ZWY2020_052442 [Hordeum vulgare]